MENPLGEDMVERLGTLQVAKGALRLARQLLLAWLSQSSQLKCLDCLRTQRLSKVQGNLSLASRVVQAHHQSGMVVQDTQ
eukprot:SAG31_NODE_9011_length_1348_cov_1.725380_1_plen_80_part_00